MKLCGIIGHNLIKACWSWGCVSAIDPNGRTICTADAHREDGRCFIVHADDKLTAFLELESAIYACRANYLDRFARFFVKLGVTKADPPLCVAKYADEFADATGEE